MIDLHLHILPGVDDGSQNMDTSVAMAYSAHQSGVRHIVATPHFYPGIYENVAGEDLEHIWMNLRERLSIERIPVRLYKGMEILGTEHLCDDLKNGKVWTLNETSYFLVEFDFDEDPEYCSRILANAMSCGYHPVIAHPERYYFVQNDPQLVYEWYINGYAIQINKGSVLGYFGKKEKDTADSLLRHHIVTCTASDAHGVYRRNASLTHLYQYLTKTYGNEYADLLTHENPSRILSGRRLVGYKPIPYDYRSERRIP